MAGLSQILKESGHDVSGSDVQFYPPMSDYLTNINIKAIQGYEAKLLPKADLYVIGNALSRGNESVEHILSKNLPYVSGPEILGRELKDRNVYAVSGTHGKTSTAYMLTHILDYNGKDVGYLVGGISENFKNPARLGKHKSFVIEADEYDSAFFDKRSKFIHYYPNNLIINNIEFDHADIFDNLDDIKKQFHHLIKVIPNKGNIIYSKDDQNVCEVLSKGYFCNLIQVNGENIKIDLSSKKLVVDNETYILQDLPLIGEHNFRNYVAAILAAQIEGISINKSIESLKSFLGVKRRMEKVIEHNGIRVYDDFAHHPTAIKLSTKAVRDENPNKKILGIVELGSNTMSSGYHKDNLFNSLNFVDRAIILDRQKVYQADDIFNSTEDLLFELRKIAKDYDIILIMTNKDSQKFITPLKDHFEN